MNCPGAIYASRRVIPADQGLDADDTAVTGVYFWLVMQQKLLIVDSTAKLLYTFIALSLVQQRVDLLFCESSCIGWTFDSLSPCVPSANHGLY